MKPTRHRSWRIWLAVVVLGWLSLIVIGNCFPDRPSWIPTKIFSQPH